MDSFNLGSPAVQSHLEMLQGVIQRMAENSRSCKFWSITALSAVLFLAARSLSEKQYSKRYASLVECKDVNNSTTKSRLL